MADSNFQLPLKWGKLLYFIDATYTYVYTVWVFRSRAHIHAVWIFLWHIYNRVTSELIGGVWKNLCAAHILYKMCVCRKIFLLDIFSTVSTIAAKQLLLSLTAQFFLFPYIIKSSVCRIIIICHIKL